VYPTTEATATSPPEVTSTATPFPTDDFSDWSESFDQFTTTDLDDFDSFDENEEIPTDLSTPEVITAEHESTTTSSPAVEQTVPLARPDEPNIIAACDGPGGQISIIDLCKAVFVGQRFGSSNPSADLDHSGTVDRNDLRLLIENYGQVIVVIGSK
jgi:hypothetical protein